MGQDINIDSFVELEDAVRDLRNMLKTADIEEYKRRLRLHKRSKNILR